MVKLTKAYQFRHFAAGAIASGLLAAIGERILAAVSEMGASILIPASESAELSSVSVGIVTLLQVAMVVAFFGALAAIGNGVAAVTDKAELQKWCFGFSSASFFIANCWIVFIVASTLYGAA